jgi:8-oxo-dGTP diphosphatase
MPHINKLYDFTVSAFIIHPTEPKLCLHYHKKLRKWLQPGGHIELDEDPIEALTHELDEEVGISLADCEVYEPQEQPTVRGQKILPLPSMFNVHEFADSGHKHIDMQYIIKSNTVQFNPKEGESPIVSWLTIDEIEKLYQSDQLYEGTFDICTWIFDKYM